MPSSGSFLRQLSGRSTSWRSASNSKYCTVEGGYNCERSLKQMEGAYMYGNDNAGLVMRKRVVVVVDQTSHSKHAMMWALTHVANKGDLLTLLHIIPPSDMGSGERTSDAYSPYLASSLGSLCKASRPEVCFVYVQEISLPSLPFVGSKIDLEFSAASPNCDLFFFWFCFYLGSSRLHE